MKEEATEFEPDIQTLGYYINRALCVMIKRLNQELKSENLNFQHSDYTIMKVLNEKDGICQSELARVLGKDRSGISRSLASLEKDGYIVRKAMNGCTNRVYLTQNGKDIIPSLNKIATKITDIAFQGFPEKKRREMMKSLTKIYRNSR